MIPDRSHPAFGRRPIEPKGWDWTLVIVTVNAAFTALMLLGLWVLLAFVALSV